MQVVRAEHAGACYGVQRALDLAEQCVRDGVGATTLGPLIHNPQVVFSLEKQGIGVASDVADVQTGTVIIRSHGVVPQVRHDIEVRGLSVVDATCPHVLHAQKSAAKLAQAGLVVLVLGEDGHPEVEGLKAYAALAGARVYVVSNPDDLPDDLPERVGVVVQTTQIKATLDQVVAALEARGVSPLVKNTICEATSQRQEAAVKLAATVDAMVVIGGRNSSNTTRLYEICVPVCARTHHIEAGEVIDPAWFEGCSVVGVTAGASTPESQIESVVSQLERL